MKRTHTVWLAWSVLFLLSWERVDDALAATQCANLNAPNPLEVCVQDSARPAVWVNQPNGRTRQYYSEYSWGSVIWLNGTNTAQRFGTGYQGGTVVTPVSNSAAGTGTAADPYVITTVTNLGATGVQMTQRFTYVNGDRTLRKTWRFDNTGATTFNDVRFFHGGDTYFGGIDSARSWYDATNRMVYVTNSSFTNSGYMGFFANPATPSSRYFAGQYNTGNGFAANTAQLPNTSNSNFVDAGYYLEWDKATLAPGEAWTFEAFETWSPPGPLQVIAPASDFTTAGTGAQKTFKVQNLTAGTLAVNLTAGATPNGWGTALSTPAAISLNTLEVADVVVDVSVPANAAPGAAEDISLTATSGSDSGVGSTRLTILQTDYAIAPTALSYPVGGGTSDQVITLSNGASGNPVQIGTIGGTNPLAAPFSIVADTCSGATIAAGASCSVTVRFTPPDANPVADSFNIPILAPVITSQTIAVRGNQAPPGHNVTATAGQGGTVSPSSAVVADGATETFTVTADPGYVIAAVQGCGGALTGNTFVTGAITADCAITASFAVATFAISPTSGAGGTISPASAVVSYGATTSFTITPDAGQSIASVQGCGGSLSANSYTTGLITSACSITVTFELTRPAFSIPTGSTTTIKASSLLTDLRSIAPQAVDSQGRPLTATLVGSPSRLGPGDHTLIWRAVDSLGVEGTITQSVRILPTVSLGADVSLGFRQGNSGSFRIALNGRSPESPLDVPYTVSGYLSGHDLGDSVVRFENGETEKEVLFAITATPPVGTPNQQVLVELGADVNRGERRTLIVRLITDNAPPVVSVSASQQGIARPTFARTGGAISVVANIRDVNSTDAHTVTWRYPTGATATVNGDTLTLQADSLAVGIYRIEAVVTDNGSPPQATAGVFDLVLRDTALQLPGGVLAWAPSGMPDDPAYQPPVRNVLPEREGQLSHFLMEGDAGLQLAMGAQALFGDRYQTELADGQSNAPPADTVANVGGFFDFVLSDLPVVGQSVRIVIPQRAQVPANAVYRKFDLVNRSWHTFVERAGDSLATAPGAEGFCPPPASEEFRPGLNAGDWCVRLTLSDGGPNDSDHQANGVVADPGGVAATASVIVRSKGNGGGGALDLGVLAIGGVLLLLRRRVVLAVAALLTSTGAFAQVWEGGVELGRARGEVSSADMNARLQEAGYDANAVVSNRVRTGWRVHGGARWSRYLGTEVAYTDFGEVRTQLTGNVLDIQAFLADAARLHPHSARGIEVVVNGWLPITRVFAFSARAGVLNWKSSYDAANQSGGFRRLTDSGANGFFGAGFEITAGLHWSFTADWTHYRVAEETLQFPSIGIVYRN